ncbi:MAG: HD domain-containing phosphohydrolase [Pseudomonadota bacterium]
MPTRLNIRYQHWALGSTFLLVVLLSGVFLFTVFRAFSQIAQDNAAIRLDLLVERAGAELDILMRGNARFVAAQATAGPHRFITGDGRLESGTLVATLISDLHAHPELYAHYVGRADDAFVQVIGVRGQPALIEALAAPPDTHFALREIRPGGGQSRHEQWTFLDRQRRPIARQTQPTRYRPTTRPWFVEAQQARSLVVTAPYRFASTGRPGITLAAPVDDRSAVFGSDIALDSLRDFLRGLPLPEHGTLAIVDRQGRLLAWHGQGTLPDVPPLTPLADLQGKAARLLATVSGSQPATARQFRDTGEVDWLVASHPVQPIAGSGFEVRMLAPLSDFLSPFARAQRDLLWVTGLVLLVLLPLSYLGSHRIVRALRSLAEKSERLKQLDFAAATQVPDTFLYEINTLGDAQNVMQNAIQHRTEDLVMARKKLARLVDNGIQLTREQNRDVLLYHILYGAREIAHCAAATLFLKTDHDSLAFALRTQDDPLPASEIPLHDADGQANDHYVAVHAALHNRTVVIDDVYTETRFDLSGTKRFSEASGMRAVSLLTVPLSPREDEVIGLLQLVNATDPKTGRIIPFDPEIVGYVEALASQSAVALENQQLLAAQKALMDALIQLIAGAIDAKSAYTGGHCARVPELAVMLAEAACAQTEGPLAEFRFDTEDQWREFRIGAWLHDCGKVTTPEYVVDKATKLETLYNRIHEIRTRFEVLLRDAEVERLRDLHERGLDRAVADARFAERAAALRDDFAFVAECNLGSEAMAPERLDRLRRIARETWLRHFDDRLGLSQEEEARRSHCPPAALPALEPLLADQPWHAVPRAAGGAAQDSRYGWQMAIPPLQYHFGELYNLSVVRGTLTEEERFKINEHIIQTIAMLEQLPFPRHLRRVPEYAGTHHETLAGTGYPRRLVAGQLSIPARIMAIADIFEALTASDRPYKAPKPLSECVKILFQFKVQGHIDPDLFDLFLSSGLYLEYARRFLKPEQIDPVDITPYLNPDPHP